MRDDRTKCTIGIVAALQPKLKKMVSEENVRRKWCQTPFRPQSHQEFGEAVEGPCAAVVGQLAPHDAHGKAAEHPIRDPFSLREGERHRSGAFVASPGDAPFRRPSVEAQRELPVHHRHVEIVEIVRRLVHDGKADELAGHRSNRSLCWLCRYTSPVPSSNKYRPWNSFQRPKYVLVSRLKSSMARCS